MQDTSRTPGEKLSDPIYVRLRTVHHEFVRQLSADEERDIATIFRRCFERGFKQMYPHLTVPAPRKPAKQKRAPN